MTSAAKNLLRRSRNWVWLVVFITVQTALSQSNGLAGRPKDMAVIQAGRWRVDYNLTSGTADIFCDGRILIPRTYAW